LIRRVRALPGSVRDVPAAALTAFARSEDRTKALQHGFEMHMAKPVDPGELVASVATLVRRNRAARPSI
jgi:CheY-like chemotaxis protein